MPIYVSIMTTVASLLSEIASFLKDAGIAETTFGRRAVNDGKLVGRLREGAGIQVGTVERVRTYISNQRAAMRAEARRRKAA